MNASDKEYLISEIIKDLDENPGDAWHIINGLKEGYPDDYKEIGLEIIWRREDRLLAKELNLNQGL